MSDKSGFWLPWVETRQGNWIVSHMPSDPPMPRITYDNAITYANAWAKLSAMACTGTDRVLFRVMLEHLAERYARMDAVCQGEVAERLIEEATG